MPKPAAPIPVYHIAPKDDLYLHVFDAAGSCWCDPDIEIDADDDKVITHHAYDRREDYEDGLRKPH